MGSRIPQHGHYFHFNTAKTTAVEIDLSISGQSSH